MNDLESLKKKVAETLADEGTDDDFYERLGELVSAVPKLIKELEQLRARVDMLTDVK